MTQLLTVLNDHHAEGEKYNCALIRGIQRANAYNITSLHSRIYITPPTQKTIYEPYQHHHIVTLFANTSCPHSVAVSVLPYPPIHFHSKSTLLDLYPCLPLSLNQLFICFLHLSPLFPSFSSSYFPVVFFL